MNRTFKTNASKEVNNHYNEYKEFHQREIEAQVCASFMEMSGMNSFDGKHNFFLLIKMLYITKTKHITETKLKTVLTIL